MTKFRRASFPPSPFSGRRRLLLLLHEYIKTLFSFSSWSSSAASTYQGGVAARLHTRGLSGLSLCPATGGGTSHSKFTLYTYLPACMLLTRTRRRRRRLFATCFPLMAAIFHGPVVGTAEAPNAGNEFSSVVVKCVFQHKNWPKAFAGGEKNRIKPYSEAVGWRVVVSVHSTDLIGDAAATYYIHYMMSAWRRGAGRSPKTGFAQHCQALRPRPCSSRSLALTRIPLPRLGMTWRGAGCRCHRSHGA